MMGAVKRWRELTPALTASEARISLNGDAGATGKTDNRIKKVGEINHSDTG